jgi:hypothetical protein
MDDNKVRNIYNNVLDDLKSKSNALDDRYQKFEEARLSIRVRANKHMLTKCSSELDWFEKNGKVELLSSGLLSLNVYNDVDKTEAEKRLAIFKACSRNNDFGSEDYFNKMITVHETIEKTVSDCIQNCSGNSKSEIQLRDCFTSCFDSYYIKMNRFFDGFENKINEFNNKL